MAVGRLRAGVMALAILVPLTYLLHAPRMTHRGPTPGNLLPKAPRAVPNLTDSEAGLPWPPAQQLGRPPDPDLGSTAAALPEAAGLGRGPAPPQPQSPPIQPPTELILRRARILSPPRPTNSQHASTLVESSAGHIVAAWFGGEWEGRPGVSIWVSHLIYSPARAREGNWTAPREVARDEAGGPLWNPVLFKEATSGELMLFYKSGHTEAAWVGWVKVSHDGGFSWGPARALGPRLLGPAKNKPLQLPDGVILAPASDESNRGFPRWTAHTEYSKDHGRTWSRGPNVPFKGDIIQGSMFIGNDNKVRMLLRRYDGTTKQGKYVKGRIVMATSDSGGITWRKAAATKLPNPNSGLDCVKLTDGRLVLASNPTTDTGGTRGPSRATLCVDISFDDGGQWKRVTCLERVRKSPNGRNWPTYSYPAIIQTQDGLVHVSYTYTERVTIKPKVGRENIMHVTLNPAAMPFR